jgi:hypothetical protein
MSSASNSVLHGFVELCARFSSLFLPHLHATNYYATIKTPAGPTNSGERTGTHDDRRHVSDKSGAS